MIDADVRRARFEEAAVRGEMAQSMVLAARGRQSDRLFHVGQSLPGLHARLEPPASPPPRAPDGGSLAA